MAERSITITQSAPARAMTQPAPQERPCNVSTLERWASLVGGGALTLYGLRRSFGSLVLAFGGGILIYRALTGHCPLYQAMGTGTTDASICKKQAVSHPRHDSQIDTGNTSK